MVAYDPWGPSLLPHDSVILIMRFLCHVSRYLIQLHSSCVHFAQQEGKRERERHALFMTTSGSNIYHFHFHPMVDSVTSNISEETGQHGLHSGQWCPLLSVNNMEVLLLKKWKADIEAGRIIVPQTYPHPNSQSIPVHMLFFMEKRLCSKNLELGRFSWSIQVGPI